VTVLYFKFPFFTETRFFNLHSWDPNHDFLTERPRDRLTFTFKFARGSFSIDHFVFHNLAIPAKLYKPKNYITEDPQHFEKVTLYKDWHAKIHRPPSLYKVTYQELAPIGDE
jgi:hypothetical protein